MAYTVFNCRGVDVVAKSVSGVYSKQFQVSLMSIPRFSLS